MKKFASTWLFGLVTIGLVLSPWGCQEPTSSPEDTEPPTLHIESPQDSALVSGIVEISGGGTDNNGIAEIILFLDNQPLGSPINSVPFLHHWDTHSLGDYTWHTLSASASDAAGNIAYADTLSVLVDNSIAGDSLGLRLYEPLEVLKYQVTLHWDPADSATFIRYDLYRNQGPLVSDAHTLVASISDPEMTIYEDSALLRGTHYSYRLYHTDSTGTYASNLIRFRTREITPSDVRFARMVTETHVNVRWEQSVEPDFETYMLRRQEDTPVTDQTPVLREFMNISTTSYADTSVRERRTYFYRIDVVDSRGNSRPGAQDSVITDMAPDPVTLEITGATQDAVDLSWMATGIPDFQRYLIYRSTEPGVTMDNYRVADITNQFITRYADRNPGTGVTYYYRIYVVDQLNQAAGSNEVSVDIAP